MLRLSCVIFVGFDFQGSQKRLFSYDEERRILWVGGASLEEGGALMGFSFDQHGNKIKTIPIQTCSSPIVGGAIVKKTNKM
jgi:hypothetical protein